MTARGSARPTYAPRPFLARAVVLGVALLLAVGPADGQVGEPKLHYTRFNTITIPFNTDPAEKRIKQVLLYVSEDQGKTWAQVAAVLPSESGFKFNARQDGWYWFGVQIMDTTGGLHPATLPELRPGLKIALDTAAPKVTLRAAQQRDFPAAVEWDIADENPDLLTLRLEYRPAGGAAWLPLTPPQMLQGQYGFNPTVGGQLEVRLQVKDKAGNTAEQVANVTAGQPNPGGPTPGPGVGGPAPQPGGNVKYVNKRNVALNYNVENEGKSGVSGVEVWYTEDGRSWIKYNLAPAKGPYTVELAKERRYGFTLVAVSGVGLADRRPMAGDPPQLWVEVDETKPAVQLLGVDVGQGRDSGKMQIRWRATDKFFGDKPIKLSYAAEINGPWQPIAEVANTGTYIWQMPDQGLPFQMYVKVEASDLAGNAGSEATVKPVAVDLLIPKATVIGVEPVTPPSPGGPGGPNR